MFRFFLLIVSTLKGFRYHLSALNEGIRIRKSNFFKRSSYLTHMVGSDLIFEINKFNISSTYKRLNNTLIKERLAISRDD